MVDYNVRLSDGTRLELFQLLNGIKSKGIRLVQSPNYLGVSRALSALPGRTINWLILLLFVYRGPESDRARFMRVSLIDFFIVLLALVFPWSTTLTIALTLAILLMVSIAHGPKAIMKQWKAWACALPVALVGLAIVGTTWAVEIPWSDQLHALGKVLKLIWVAPIFLHFQRTRRAPFVFGAYIVSNIALLAFSFMTAYSPAVLSAFGSINPGVPVKNYIDQSHGFAFVAVILLALAIEALRSKQRSKAILYLSISAAFFANLVFVNIARTAFIYIPVMLTLLILRYGRGWLMLVSFVALLAAASGLWVISPNLQSKMQRLLHENEAYEVNATTVNGFPAGGAERLEFWRKSLGFVRSSPLIGHGTGSARMLFATEATGQTGIRAKVVDNPHNQTLAVAIQWGLVGCFLLYAMWGSHLFLFRTGLTEGPASVLAWIGLIAVAQNFTSSLFNSHLFDFYQGWLYVFAIGIVGGQLQNARSAENGTYIEASRGLGCRRLLKWRFSRRCLLNS